MFNLVVYNVTTGVQRFLGGNQFSQRKAKLPETVLRSSKPMTSYDQKHG